MKEPNQGRLPEGVRLIPLDGSYGAGADTELTIVTRKDGQLIEKTYIVPFLALDMKKIQGACDINLIVGFKIVKSEEDQNPGLRELGL